LQKHHEGRLEKKRQQDVRHHHSGKQQPHGEQSERGLWQFSGAA
jgi:hypothetical protein